MAEAVRVSVATGLAEGVDVVAGVAAGVLVRVVAGVELADGVDVVVAVAVSVAVAGGVWVDVDVAVSLGVAVAVALAVANGVSVIVGAAGPNRCAWMLELSLSVPAELSLSHTATKPPSPSGPMAWPR